MILGDEVGAHPPKAVALGQRQGLGNLDVGGAQRGKRGEKGEEPRP